VGSSSKIVKANRPVIGQILGMLRWWHKSVGLCAATRSRIERATATPQVLLDAKNGSRSMLSAAVKM
jgi:hypothetical protein